MHIEVPDSVEGEAIHGTIGISPPEARTQSNALQDEDHYPTGRDA